MATLQINYVSKSLRRTVTFNALLPIDQMELPGQEKLNKTMKSLYLLHGFFGNYTDWIYGTKIHELSQKYNIAVFMPSGENNFYVDDADKKELFGEFVGLELVEFTRKMFHLSERREDTWIGGLSMGGYGAIRNGLKYADNFSRIIALSSALVTYGIPQMTPDFVSPFVDYKYFTRVFGDLSKVAGSDMDPEALIINLKKENKLIPKIFMSCGTEDPLLKDNRQYRDFLQSENTDITYEEKPGGHTWDYWNETIEDGIRWALK